VALVPCGGAGTIVGVGFGSVMSAASLPTAEEATARVMAAVESGLVCEGCSSAAVNVALVPCGHCLHCDSCAATLTPAACPRCLLAVRDAVPVFRSDAEPCAPPKEIPPLREQPIAEAPAAPLACAARAYVIHLERRSDRRQTVLELLGTLAPHLPAERFAGSVDAAALGWDGVARAAGAVPWRGWELAGAALAEAAESAGGLLGGDYARPVRIGELGCAASHLAAWRDALQRRLDLALFFEDDLLVEADFMNRLREELHLLDKLQGEEPWDLLYLGRQKGPRAVDGARVTPRLIRPGFSFCTHAYALSRSGLEKLCASGYEARVLPLDDFLPALYADGGHPRKDVRDLLAHLPRLHALAWCEEADEADAPPVHAWGDARGLAWQRLNPGSDTRETDQGNDS